MKIKKKKLFSIICIFFALTLSMPTANAVKCWALCPTGKWIADNNGNQILHCNLRGDVDCWSEVDC